MKENFIHVCFVIDESGSMYSSVSDVLGGFKKVIDEQKENKNGTCSISLYKFSGTVQEVYKGKDVNSVDYLNEKTYNPGGSTAMNDGIGVAIDSIGKWLNSMTEEEKPEKNLFVIMTDGYENASRKYNLSQVKEMIKEQEEKYSWTFMYLGTDISNTEQADSLGIVNQGYTTRNDVSANYVAINSIVTSYRNTIGSATVKSMAADACLSSNLDALNTKYKKDTGIDLGIKKK